MIAVQLQTNNVVAPEKTVTVVTAQPNLVAVTEVSKTVSVVTTQVQNTIVTRPISPTVVPVDNRIVVVSKAPQVGPKIFFSPTPPSGARLNDIWIKTA